MTTAILFPGQGNHEGGFDQAFIEAWPKTTAAFEEMAATVDTDLRSAVKATESDGLRATNRVQPATLAVGVATWHGLKERLSDPPAFMAGHSLGHWSALTAAGGIDRTTAVRLVARRGEAMAAAARSRGPGGMLVVLGADTKVVTRFCADVDGVGIGAYNAERQTVVTGHREGLDELHEKLRESDTRARCRNLDVPLAFHSSIVAPAIHDIKAALAAADLRRTTVPVISDVTADIYREPERARDELVAQTTAPVRWRDVVDTLRSRGVDRVIEMPPAGTLTGLVKRTAPEIETVTLDTPTAIPSG